MEKTDNTEIDTNLYSRQIGTFGIETMSKLVQMKVAIVGLRGLGVEIAKNLILAGPKEVHLFDPDMTQVADLGANFYCEEKHVGKTCRHDASIEKLRQLNPYVQVKTVASEADLAAMIKGGQVNVVCQTELMLGGKYVDPELMDKECRNNKVGFISSQTLGPWGYAFLDYGIDHTIFDHDGE